jgi:hypothetical protein
MLRPLALLLALAAASGCSARRVEDEGQSRRHLAAQWCEDWCTFWYGCRAALMGKPTDECKDRCESDEAWDRTDECGDIRWEFRECNQSLTCEEHLEALDKEELFPCQHLYNEYVLQGCTQ